MGSSTGHDVLLTTSTTTTQLRIDCTVVTR
jgi:hypothetical protein